VGGGGGGGGGEWIQLAQDRNWWQALVNTVMNLRFLGPRSWVVTYLVAYLVSYALYAQGVF
jgi:hypothetical protein